MSEFNGQGGHAGPSGPSGVLLQFTRFGDQWRQRAHLPWKPILLALIALLVLLGSVYTVEPEEVGIVLRFGQYVREAKPGLNFKLPLGIESVIKVPVERQLKEEFGFRTVQAGVRTEYSQSQFDDESLMLTGDLNIADVEWVVQYRIVDAYKYLFKVRDVRETFRAMTEAVVREVVGDRTVNEVLTVGRQEVASLVEQRLQALCDQYETGLKVEQVVLQNVNPPEKVKPSFNAVNQAQQEREERINTAQREYNQVIPRAKGRGAADDRSRPRATPSTGSTARRATRPASTRSTSEYRKAPEVTRKRIYLETMGKVLPKAGKKVVVDEDVKGVLPLLNLQGATLRPRDRPTGGQLMHRFAIVVAVFVGLAVGLERRLRGLRARAGDHHAVRHAGRPAGGRAGLSLEAAASSRRSTTSTSASSSGTARPTSCRPATSASSGSTPTPAGGSATR